MLQPLSNHSSDLRLGLTNGTLEAPLKLAIVSLLVPPLSVDSSLSSLRGGSMRNLDSPPTSAFTTVPKTRFGCARHRPELSGVSEGLLVPSRRVKNRERKLGVSATG